LKIYLNLNDINDVEEIVNYIKALNYGIDRLEKFPMSIRFIKELHAILLQHTRGIEKTSGEFKRSQNWIGAPGSTLQNTIYVPPPPEDTLDAMPDLEKYLHEDSPFPDLVNCALIHYQFETIHPFLDGNGRVGRLLIIMYLMWKNVIKFPLLYISYYLKKNRQEYYDRLTMVREKGNYEQWVSFFIDGVIETSESAIDTIKKILTLRTEHQKLLWKKKLSSPFATVLFEHLFYAPIVTVTQVQQEFNVTYPTASNTVKQFVEAGILKEVTGKKRDQRFVYKKYLDILSQGAQPL